MKDIKKDQKDVVDQGGITVSMSKLVDGIATVFAGVIDMLGALDGLQGFLRIVFRIHDACSFPKGFSTRLYRVLTFFYIIPLFQPLVNRYYVNRKKNLKLFLT